MGRAIGYAVWFPQHPGYRHGEDKLRTGCELNSVAVGGDLIAAAGTCSGLEFQILYANNNPWMNSVGRSAGIQILVECVGAVYSLAHLPDSSGNLSGQVLMRVVRGFRGTDDCDDSQLQRLLIVVVAIGAVENEGNLGRTDGDDAGVNDGIDIEGTAWIVKRARELEPYVLAGLKVSGIETGDLCLDSGSTRNGQVGHGSACDSASRSSGSCRLGGSGPREKKGCCICGESNQGTMSQHYERAPDDVNCRYIQMTLTAG